MKRTQVTGFVGNHKPIIPVHGSNKGGGEKRNKSAERERERDSLLREEIENGGASVVIAAPLLSLFMLIFEWCW